MKNAIEYVIIGECKVDLPLAIKKWNLLCRIYKYKDEYTLVEHTPKGKTRLKVSIRKDDANYLIQELRLRSVQNMPFNNDTTYLSLG